jgi:gas vesicle protein
MSKKNEIVVSTSWKTKTILGGALAGALVGIIAAWLLTRRATRQRREAALTPAEGAQLGFLIFGLLRAIAGLGDKK